MNPALQTPFLVAGGLGLFLFGMKMMSGGIEVLAGDRLQSILQRATSNRFFAVLVGILATIAINSSTATTIMTVSFVNSGLMNLAQAIGVIMGANVGTTFSSHLVAFRVDAYAPLFIFVGIIMHLFLKKKSAKNVGYVILGFGVLFFGITTMGTPLRGLANDPSFNALLTTFENPILAVLAGFIFTAVIQSSSATMGLLVTLHISGVPIPFETSAYIVLGTNIGTSITTVIASIPANRESKRAALFHIMFDIIGSTVFGTLIFLFPGILQWFQSTWSESGQQVAMFHTFYNFATLFLILPFVRQVAALMIKIVPLQASDKVDTIYEKKLMYMDTKVAQSPALALRNAHLELCRIQKISKETLELALAAFFEKDADKAKKVLGNEKIINTLTRKTSDKLVKINKMTLTQPNAKKIGKMFRVLYDIERIGDHAENIAEHAVNVMENELKFSNAAIDELKELGTLVSNITEKSLSAFENNDPTILPQIKEIEKSVDSLSAAFTENHVNRLTNEACEPRCGVVFTDMIIDLERCADHANNIASSMLPKIKVKKNSKK
ncbi:MAG: Na/Pi cotransporter family protein [Defluviitaleaceae bacterium]|nr:Na/Pi cotransporter family protein [Defluviitaleaceae bacterium]